MTSLVRLPAALGLALLSASIAATHAAEPAAGTPQLLPQVNVNANVPLVKVAEYHLRENRFAPAAVTVGDYIYVIGGSNLAQGKLKSVERFDPRTGRSDLFAKMGTGRDRLGAVALNGKIYVMGGITDSGIRPPPPPPARIGLDPSMKGEAGYASNSGLVTSATVTTSSIEIVDTVTGRVTAGPRLPGDRGSFGCVAWDGKIYVFGGFKQNSSQFLATGATWILDVATGKWTQGATMTEPRQAAAVVVDGGFMLLAGGYNSGASDEVSVYDPRKDGWAKLPPLARRTSAAAPVFLGKYLFLFGDYGSPEEILAYDLTTKTSETFTLAYRPARHTAATTYNGMIYVFGGKDDAENEALDLVQVYALASAHPSAGTR